MTLKIIFVSLAYPFICVCFLSCFLLCDDHLIGGSKWGKFGW